MRSSASPGHALRRLAELRHAVARVRARDFSIVLGRVVAVLFCLELVYLGIGNGLLQTQLIQRAVSASEGFALEFGTAYTTWPGRVHVRDVSLRVEDYNVQFEVAIARARLDIALSELPFKKFHVTQLAAEGTRFRMRHKLIAVGDDAERVAAYPGIKGFSDPPYFVGVRPGWISDAEADSELWKVRIEQVQARVSELWVMEYRYQGAGEARGSFAVHPTRWVQVSPASLSLHGGSLTLGEHVVARQVIGKISCDIPDMDVQEHEGAKVLKDVSAGIALDLKGGKLSFLRAYLGHLGARYAGSSELKLDLRISGGVVQQGSRIDVLAKPLEVEHEFASLAGDVMLSLQRDLEPQLKLAVSAPRLVATRKRPGPSPYLEGVAASVALLGADLTEELPLGGARLAVTRAHAGSLSWFAPAGTQLGGALDASFELSRSPENELAGGLRLALSDGELSHSELGLASDVKSEVMWTRGAEPDAPFEVQKLRVQLSSASLRSGDNRSKAFDALVEGAGVQLTSSGNATGRLRARISDADALLPLVMGAALKGITSTALNLKQLDAETSVQLSRHSQSVKLLDARSGNLRASGYFRQERNQPRGAFLLSSGPLNVGVTVSDGGTEVSPFVGDGWLTTAWPRILRSEPGAG